MINFAFWLALALLLSSCDGGQTASTQGVATTATAPGGTSAACTNTELTEPSSATGQITFSVDSTIDPCTVSGYVVGYQEDLKVKKTADGTFHIDNIPPGDHDIIVTGTLVVTTLGLEAKKDKAVRLGKQTSLAGVRKEKGKLELPDVASISGKVTLTGRTDHAGIHVYIPGTGFDATTDTDGSYTIAPYVPSGINNLFFEKDGYHRGQIEEIKVAAGSETTAPEIQLILSTGAKGFVLIDGGEAITSSKSVILTIGATSDAVLMKISENQAFVGADWEPIITRKAYSFASFGDKILYIKFANENGLESTTYQDSIAAVDYSQAGTIAINAGAGYTVSAQVTINLAASGVDKMYVTNSAGCAAGGNWVAYAASSSWTLGTINATTTVYVKLRDKVGNESACLSDDIIHDNILPVANSISIASGATYANTASVSLDLSANGASEMYVSNTAGCTSGGAWETYSTTKTWTLGQLNQTATVYAKFKDLAGNESSCISDSIIHDNTVPSGTSISINGGAGYVTTTTVALSLAATDTNAVQMYITNTSGCGSGGTWANKTSTTSWVLGQTNATATVYVKYMDAAGNESACISDNIVHDNTTPTFSMAASYSRGASMTVTISATEINSLEVKIDSSAAFSSASYQAFSTPFSMPYAKNIKIQLKDAAGNESSVYDYVVSYTATLSQARIFISKTTVGTKSIFAGGSSSDASNAVDIYDSSSNTWSTATLSPVRFRSSATTIGTKAFFGGGYNNNDGYLDVVDIYDSSSNTWSTATLSQARGYLSATTVGTKAFFGGGHTSSVKSNVVDIYDSSSNTWSTATLSQARYELSATTVGTKAIFAGGTSASGYSNVVDIYDSLSNSWSTATLSVGRKDLAATTVGTKAIFAGGSDNSSFSNVVDIYDSSSNTWSATTLSQARHSLSATTVGTKAIFAGGRSGMGVSSNVVDIYDSSSNTWSTATLSQARYGLSATTVGTKAIFAGGNSASGDSTVVDIYDSSTNTWSTEL